MWNVVFILRKAFKHSVVRKPEQSFYTGRTILPTIQEESAQTGFNVIYNGILSPVYLMGKRILVWIVPHLGILSWSVYLII